MNNNNDKLAFSHLPPEIQRCITSFITSDHHKRIARLVSRVWNLHIDYNKFSIGLLLASETDQLIKCFGRYDKPIGLKFVKLLHTEELRRIHRIKNPSLINESQLTKAIENLTQLTSLNLSLPVSRIPKTLTNLQQLTVMYTFNTKADKAILASLSHLTSLSASVLHIETKLPPSLESIDCDMILYAGNTLEPSTRLTSLTTRFHDPALIRALPNLRRLIDRSLSKIDVSLVPNLEELSTTGPFQDCELKHLTKLDVSCLDNQPPVKLTSILPQLKVLKCHRIDLQDIDMNVLQSLESCIIRDSTCQKAVLSNLNPNKVTELLISDVSEYNFRDLCKLTRLTDLTSTFTGDTEPKPVLFTSLTILSIHYKVVPMQWLAVLFS